MSGPGRSGGTPAGSVPATPLVLVGMSRTEVVRRQELLALAAALAAGPRPVEVAFLQQAEPSLGAVLTELADAGAERVVLVAVVSESELKALAPGPSWLRRVAGHWWRERPEPRPELLVGAGLCEPSAEAVTAAVAQAWAITGEEPGLTSPAWEVPPAARKRLLVCRGPRCTAKGAEDTLRALILATMEQGVGDVLITQTGCQEPCNLAPVVSVEPDGVWHAAVSADRAAEVVSGL